MVSICSFITQEDVINNYDFVSNILALVNKHNALFLEQSLIFKLISNLDCDAKIQSFMNEIRFFTVYTFFS